MLWIRPFQFGWGGNHTSTPIPGLVEGASTGPGLPGPTMSLTRNKSAGAAGVKSMAGSDRTNGSPVLKAVTSTTLVRSSPANTSRAHSSKAVVSTQVLLCGGITAWVPSPRFS